MGVFSQGRLEPGRSCARLFIQSCAAFGERRPLRAASPLISAELRVQPPRIPSVPLERRTEGGRQQTERENHPRHEAHVYQKTVQLWSRPQTLLVPAYPPSSPKASSLTAHPPRHMIGRRQNNQPSDWTRGIFLCRDVRYFMVLHRPLVEKLRKRLGKRFPVGSWRFGFPRIF